MSGKAARRELLGAEALREVPLWVGRDELLAELKAALVSQGSQAAPKVLVLVGQGGIGKTSLAMKLLEELGVDRKRGLLTDSCAYDGVVCFRAEEGAGFDEVAGELLGALGLGQQEFVQDGEKIRAILTGLRQQRWLVLLDNWEVILHPGHAAQAGRCVTEELGQLLNSLVYEQHQSQVVITSRERLKDLADPRDVEGGVDPRLVREKVIEGIDDTASVALLKRIGLQDSEEDLQWIAERVQGNVLVLTLLARWAKKPGMLRKRPDLVVSRAEAIVLEQLARQSEAAQELLKRMVVLRVPIDLEGLTFLRLYETDAPEFGDLELDETQTMVTGLVNSSLVQERYDEANCNDFYDLHRVIENVLLMELETELSTLREKAFRLYMAEADFEDLQDFEDLRPLIEAQHFSCQLKDYEKSITLIEILEEYLEPWGYWNLLIELYTKILEESQQDQHFSILKSLGFLHRKKGNWDKAEYFLLRALESAKGLEVEDGEELTYTLIGSLGDICRARGNLDQAEDLYLEMLDGCIEFEDYAGMAEVFGTLGTLERIRSNWGKACEYFERALDLWEKIGSDTGVANASGLLGDVMRHFGKYKKASTLYEKALRIWENLQDKSGISSILRQMGGLEYRKDNFELARQLYRASLELAEELGESDAMADIYYALAWLDRTSRMLEDADQNYQTAHRLFTQLGAAKDLECIEKEWAEN